MIACPDAIQQWLSVLERVLVISFVGGAPVVKPARQLEKEVSLKSHT